jgi:hypothetical protein
MLKKVRLWPAALIITAVATGYAVITMRPQAQQLVSGERRRGIQSKHCFGKRLCGVHRQRD